jgi:hypothetical protein
MRGLRFLVVLAIAGPAACGGGNPGGPSETPAGGGLPFREGQYALDMLGDSSLCGDIKNPQAGTAVSVRVTFRRDATGWTATTERGTLTLRFERGPLPNEPGNPFALGISGPASGAADDEGVLIDPRFSVPPNGTRLTFGDGASLSGSMPSPQVSDFSLGRIAGTVTFSRNGVASTCPSGAVSWTLNRFQS